MITTLKRTTMFLSVFVCVEMMVIAFGGFVPPERDAYAMSSILAMNASEAVYIPPVEEETVKEAAEEEVVPEEIVVVGTETEAEVEVEVEVEEQSYQESCDDSAGTCGDFREEIARTYGLVPYDGSGHYDANLNGAWYSGADFAFTGGYGYDDDSGFSFTWYSENVLPGGGLNIPGRHVNDEGYVVDGSGFLCIASDYLPEGTIVTIPFGIGTGVVRDTGSGYGNLDIYTSW